MAKIFMRSNNTYVFKNCMRKRNLILPFFVGSLFIPSLESIQSATVFNVLENENITFQAIDEIPLASTSGATGGGGGGGGNSAKSKRKKAKLKKNQKKAKEAARKRIEAKKSEEQKTKVATQNKLAEPKALHPAVKETTDKLDQIKNKIISLRDTISNENQKKDLDDLVSFIEESKNEIIRLYKESTNAVLTDLEKRIKEYKKDKFPRIKNILDNSEKYLDKKLADAVEQVYDFTWKLMQRFKIGILSIQAASENNPFYDPEGS